MSQVTETTVNYDCAQCEHTFDVDVTFAEEARIWGPPDKCHPGSPASFTPQYCPECDAEIDAAEVYESACDWVQGDEEDYE